MSRQLDQEQEERTAKRNQALVNALDYGLPGAFESQGIELLGIAIKYDAYNCLMTIKAEIAGVRQVCFVGSDSISNCFLKALSDARRGALKWRKDKYHQD